MLTQSFPLRHTDRHGVKLDNLQVNRDPTRRVGVFVECHGWNPETADLDEFML